LHGISAIFHCSSGDWPPRRAIGNRNGEAVNLSNLATTASASGEIALARSQLLEALAIMREIGDRRSEAAILRHLEELE